MNSELRTCQNCRNSFEILPEDFVFYQKIGVPAPTFCPECRFQRRLMFRNERVLYRRECNFCKAKILSTIAPDKLYKVYCGACWWSDKWSAEDYGQDYDPSRPFFEQFQSLQKKVPYMNLVTTYSTLVNSDYTNHVAYLKNCYLSFNGDYSENVLYANTFANMKDSMDIRMVGESELCYEDIDFGKGSRVFFSEACENSHDIYFSKNVVGSSNCFGCVNLINKKYHFLNKQYSKEEYEKKLEEMQLDTFSGAEDARKMADSFFLRFPNKFTHTRYNVNSTGEYVFYSKNAKNIYQARFVEDSKFCQLITLKPMKDSYDYTEWGQNAQRIYEAITVGESADMVKFSSGCWMHVLGVEYSMYVIGSANMFGCIGLRNKNFCILNKQYTEMEYKKLREKIIEDMNTRPYIDSQERVFTYGEFFPYDLSIYDYNESTASEYFPLDEGSVRQKGWRWQDSAANEYEITLESESIPDSVNDVPNSIVNEIIRCRTCKRAFRIVAAEFDLLRRFQLPVPRDCPECRNKARMRRIGSFRLYHAKCQCTGDASANNVYTNQTLHFHGSRLCPNEFETSFAPDRPEIVYCESCYQSEVA